MRRARSYLGAELQARGDTGKGGDLPLFAPPAPFSIGMAQSAAAASCWSPEERAEVDQAIRTLAARAEPFTADDVWKLARNTRVTKGIASRLRPFVTSGTIRKTGRKLISTRGGKHDHAQELTEWIGGPKP